MLKHAVLLRAKQEKWRESEDEDGKASAFENAFSQYKRRNQMYHAEYASETRKLKDWIKKMKLGMEGIKGMIKNYVENKLDKTTRFDQNKKD